MLRRTVTNTHCVTPERRAAEVGCSHDVARQVLMPRRLMSGRLLCSARARNAIHYQFNEARRGALQTSAPDYFFFSFTPPGNFSWKGSRAESYTQDASRTNCFPMIFDLYTPLLGKMGRIKKLTRDTRAGLIDERFMRRRERCWD